VSQELRRVSLATIAALAVASCAPALAAPAAPAALSGTATPVSLWASDAVPAVKAEADTGAVELGVRFETSTAGSLQGVRFYKGSTNTGTHTGSLWTATGTKLATATFAGETTSGWQTVTFSAAVRLTANTTYVASYHTTRGYAADQNYFATSGRTSSPLYAFRNGEGGGNGLYRYGASSAFPNQTWNATNYWVDVTFTPDTTPTPTPTPTVTPTPTPTPTGSAPDCVRKVWSNLVACGWPGPGNTGYPAGTSFTQTKDSTYTVTADNTVIDGWRVTGGIEVAAKNVTIRNSWVTKSAGGANGSGVVNVHPGKSATIEHNLLDGLNATHSCIWHEGSSMTARYNNCQGVNDGVFSWATTTGVDGTGDNFDIEDNYLHAFTTQAANGHIDGYQTEGAKNGVLRHNTFDVTQDQDSDVAIWNSRKTSDNILVEHNLLAGGGFAVYAEDYNPSEASPAGGYSVKNIRFTNNVFSTVHYGCVGNWGVWFTRGAPTDQWNRNGNVVLESGQNIDNGNPTNKGVVCS